MREDWVDIKMRYDDEKGWEEVGEVDVITARARELTDWLGAVPRTNASDPTYCRYREEVVERLDGELHNINHVAFREGLEAATNLLCPICAAGYKLDRIITTVPSAPAATRYEHTYRRQLSESEQAEAGCGGYIYPVTCPAAAIHRKLDEYADETGRETRQGSGGRPPQEPGPELIVNDLWWKQEALYPTDWSGFVVSQQVGTLYPGAHAVIRDLTDASIGCTDDGQVDE